MSKPTLFRRASQTLVLLGLLLCSAAALAQQDLLDLTSDKGCRFSVPAGNLAPFIMIGANSPHDCKNGRVDGAFIYGLFHMVSPASIRYSVSSGIFLAGHSIGPVVSYSREGFWTQGVSVRKTDAGYNLEKALYALDVNITARAADEQLAQLHQKFTRTVVTSWASDPASFIDKYANINRDKGNTQTKNIYFVESLPPDDPKVFGRSMRGG